MCKLAVRGGPEAGHAIVAGGDSGVEELPTTMVPEMLPFRPEPVGRVDSGGDPHLELFPLRGRVELLPVDPRFATKATTRLDVLQTVFDRGGDLTRTHHDRIEQAVPPHGLQCPKHRLRVPGGVA